MPIRDREDAAEVEAGIARAFGAAPEERAAAIRQLFVEVLDFNPAQGQVSLASAPAGVELPDTAERVAALEGVHVVYVALDAPASGRVRKGDVSAAARLIADQIGDDLLLVFTNAGVSQLHLVRPEFGGTRATLRRMVVERDLPRRTAVQQISEIYWNRHDTGAIRSALDQAFDVEPVTKRFFAEYKRVFERVERSITGFAEDETEARRLFVQTLFNRLMFVYFLSRKGWLTFREDKDYLNALFRDYQATGSENKNFYFNRLRLLFFAGLNNYRSEDLTAEPQAHRLIGSVPFLNGGLFHMTDEDGRTDVVVPDACIAEVLERLFDRFNFTVMESTPFDIEVAVDPEMLGKVFEELVNDRHDSGTYYTPRPVVSFMCREALKGYLEGMTRLGTESIRALVDEHDVSRISLTSAQAVAGALDEITVVDPACGSGAYLLGMMQELVELWTILYSDRLKTDDRSHYDLKLHIIERNLYGVDIDQFAVNIAMLRMWLSLAIEYEGSPPIRPLPNLDFKIVRGDSLLAPDPSAGVTARETAGAQMMLGRDPERMEELDTLKGEYMRETDPSRKSSLHTDINGIREALREGVEAAPAGSLDWRIEFAEVFAHGGGFDIVLANPPYRQLQKEGGKLANTYKNCGFETFARTGDIYQLFYERGCHLTKADRGLLAYITSNSWLRAEYGKSLRRFFAERHTPLRWLDLGKDVFESAIVDSGVLLLRTGREPTHDADRDSGDSEQVERDQGFPAVDMERLAGGSFPPPESEWGRVRSEGEAPWSILSPAEQHVMGKMRAVGVPLAEWGLRISRGVITGYNKAFIIDDATRDELIAEEPRSAEIIKPMIRGRDIRRYRAQWARRWLILAKFGSHEYLAADYPAVYQHLLRHEHKLRNRGQVRYTRSRGKNRSRGYPGQHHWLELDNNPTDEFLELFAKPKLIWIELVDRGRFAYDDSGVLGEATTFVMTGPSIKYLCAVLNSTLVHWTVKQIAPTSGMGTPRWKKAYVERIPVPRVSEEEQRPFVELADRIIEVKDDDPEANTEEWERAIDRLVYDLYGLTEEEDTAVERALGLIHPTDEAEDAAILQTMLERARDADDSVRRDAVMASLRASSGA